MVGNLFYTLAYLMGVLLGRRIPTLFACHRATLDLGSNFECSGPSEHIYSVTSLLFTTITKYPHSHTPFAPSQPRSKSMILNMFEHHILKNDNNCSLAPPPCGCLWLEPPSHHLVVRPWCTDWSRPRLAARLYRSNVRAK